MILSLQESSYLVFQGTVEEVDGCWTPLLTRYFIPSLQEGHQGEWSLGYRPLMRTIINIMKRRSTEGSFSIIYLFYLEPSTYSASEGPCCIGALSRGRVLDT